MSGASSAVSVTRRLADLDNVRVETNAQVEERSGWLEGVGRSVVVSLTATGAGGVAAWLVHRAFGGDAELVAVVALAVLFGGLFHFGYAAFLPGRAAVSGELFGIAMLLLTATTVQAAEGLDPLAVIVPYLVFGVVTGAVAGWLGRHLPSGVSWWSGTAYAIAFGTFLLLGVLFVVVSLDPASGSIVSKLAIASAFGFGFARHLVTRPPLRIAGLAVLGLFCILAALPLLGI